jgi:uncharacterized repeat protein (TIGR04052 family)
MGVKHCTQSFLNMSSKRLGNNFIVREISTTTTVCLMLAAIFIVSCTPSKQTVRIEFRPVYNNKAINCDLGFQRTDENWSIKTFGMFLSSLQLVNSRGEEQIVELVKTNWQTTETGLLWFIPGCEHNNELSNTFNQNLLIKLDAKDLYQAKQLTFSLAVPFEQNHANPLTQTAPLNNPEMFWTWQTGHKFMRFDLKQVDSRANWAFHLGSVGCTSKSALRAPNQECSQPNRLKVDIDIPKHKGNKPEVLVVNINIDTMVNGIDISNSKPCMFTLNDQVDCLQVLQNLNTKPVFTASWQGQP